jgi:hypothetical protein
MAERTREYSWYRTGCARLGQEPLEEAAFAVRWQELEDHAEKLKTAEKSGSPPEIDPSVRAEMQRRIKEDPFVKAVLVGMAEDPDAGENVVS